MPDPVEVLLAAARDGLIPGGASLLLAVSGGADSLALLYASREVAGETGWRLAVGHVHHGWPHRRREADRDLDFVADHARRLGLPFFAKRRDARTESRQRGLSPEAGARAVRYAALAEMAEEAGASLVATAHQADDVVESHLIARARRGGVRSLAGPRPRREDGVVRPLLPVSRREIEAYLALRGLAWRRDSTNGDLRLTRNAVRRRTAVASPEQRAAWAAEAARCAAERERLDRDLARSLGPALRTGPDVRLVDDGALRPMDDELLRAALEEAARPFARPGRPPMTGPERERLILALRGEGDFAFEAGRRIAVRRRGRTVSFGLREARASRRRV